MNEILGCLQHILQSCMLHEANRNTLTHCSHHAGFTSSGLLGHGSRQVITSTSVVGPCGRCAQIKRSNHLDTYTWVVCGEVYKLRTDTKKTLVSKRLDYMLTMCLLSRFNIQHGWESLYDHLMSMKFFTLLMKNISIGDLVELMRQMAAGTFWIC